MPGDFLSRRPVGAVTIGELEDEEESLGAGKGGRELVEEEEEVVEAHGGVNNSAKAAWEACEDDDRAASAPELEDVD